MSWRSSTPVPVRLGWLLVGASLVLHFFTVVAFARQPDAVAAFTVFPIWLWGALGLCLAGLAFIGFRTPLSLVVCALWGLTILLAADEARVLAHLGVPAPAPGPAEPVEGRKPIRVITLNVADFRHGDPFSALAAWHPDLVLLQEDFKNRSADLAERLFSGSGHHRTHHGNAIVSRWPITREVRNNDKDLRFVHFNATIQLPDGTPIDLVNIHLTSAATDLRLWAPDCWREHRENRRQRRFEIRSVLRVLKETTPFPARPVIVAGDFNAPATDPLRLHLEPRFRDAFLEAGTGWGNTYHRRVPILRIDQVHVTRHFKPARCQAVTTRHSDHRFVVADLVLE